MRNASCTHPKGTKRMHGCPIYSFRCLHEKLHCTALGMTSSSKGGYTFLSILTQFRVSSVSRVSSLSRIHTVPMSTRNPTLLPTSPTHLHLPTAPHHLLQTPFPILLATVMCVCVFLTGGNGTSYKTFYGRFRLLRRERRVRLRGRGRAGCMSGGDVDVCEGPGAWIGMGWDGMGRG